MRRLRALVCVFGVALIAAGAWTAAQPKARKNKRAKKKLVDRQYKKFGRPLMTKIASGEIDAAIRDAEQVLVQLPGDCEALYFLAIAQAQKGRVDEAVATAKKALAGGLAIGRFLAGPRTVARPLLESKAFQALAAKHAVRLVHGPMVGAVTHERARFWVRTAAEMPVAVVLTQSGAPGPPIRSAVVNTKADRDFTAMVELAGLQPATQYDVAVHVGGKPVALEAKPSFRTFPKPGAKGRFQVAFGGGAGYTPQHERMWNTLAGHKLTAFLTLGDNVYIDTPEVPETQRYCYYRRQSRPEWRRFVASTPVFSIWDDHDFGTNDCKGSPGIDDVPWKVPVWNVFRENWVNPSYGSGDKQPGVWYDFTIGDVDFIMLDCRFYRVLGTKGKDDDSGTMLGPVQKKWLLGRLARAKGTFKVLASSVPWSKGTKGGSRDTWDGFNQEREEILSFLAENRVEGVFLISADRHRSDAYKTERPNAYPLYEASSSRLTNVHTHGIIKHSLFGYNEKCSFGLLTFDTARADPELTYQVVNIDDEVIHTLKIKRSELSFTE